MKPINPNAFWFALILSQVSEPGLLKTVFAGCAVLIVLGEIIEDYLKDKP
jgi:hypothetical protein